MRSGLHLSQAVVCIVTVVLGSIELIACTRQLDGADGVAAARARGGEQSKGAPSVAPDAGQREDAALAPTDASPDASISDASPDSDVDGDGDGPAPFVLVRRWDEARFELTPETEEGGFDDADLELAKQAWARYKTLQTTDIHPRLISVIYEAARHFEAPYVVITSGYRPGSKSSMHYWGRAADIQIPGVPCRKLAEHLRTHGFVGVGVYPRTGGVHVDIRRESYYWISWAPRGKRWRERGILLDLAKRMDKEALSRGVEPPAPLPEAGKTAREAASWRRRRAANRRRAAKRRGKRGKARSVKRPVKRRPVKKAVRAKRGKRSKRSGR